MKALMKNLIVTLIIGITVFAMGFASGTGVSLCAKTEPAELKIENSKFIDAVVTAYCPCPKCCGKYADGITASGKPVTANGGKFCAADKKYPFGTLVIIPGYNNDKPVPVLDRGGAIRGEHFDVFFATHEEALNWGRKNLSVQIEGKP